MGQSPPGKGLWGWLGRQFGYVTKAVRKDVVKTIVHREERVEEAKLPERPGMILRRTVIDEVIVDKKAQEGRKEPDAGAQSPDTAASQSPDS